MKLHFIRTPKQRSAVVQELYELLARRGFDVTESVPDAAVTDLDASPGHDLYILKTRTQLAVSVAGILQQRGARLLNPYPACVTLLNKIVVTAAMRRAGIPVPRSWATRDPSLLGSVARDDRVPLILKPFDGIHSRGIRVVSDPDEFGAIPAAQSPLLAQEFIEGCDERLKVHCVGDRVFATWKPFSLGGTHERGRPREVSDELRGIAMRCGALFGLGLYGLDVLIGRDGPVVVDVNSFPGYNGVPGIAAVIADYIGAYARGEVGPQVDSHLDAPIGNGGGAP